MLIRSFLLFLPAFLRKILRPGKKFLTEIQIVIIQMLWNLCQKKFKIFVGFQSICLGSFCDTVDDCAELAAFPALFGRKFFQRLFVSIDCLDHNQSPMRSTLISFFFRKCFQSFIVSASYVYPTSGNLKIFPFCGKPDIRQ